MAWGFSRVSSDKRLDATAGDVGGHDCAGSLARANALRECDNEVDEAYDRRDKCRPTALRARRAETCGSLNLRHDCCVRLL